MNTKADEIVNIFDIKTQTDPKVKQKQKDMKLEGSKLVGTIKYFSIMKWDEYKIKDIDELKYALEIYNFIEEAVSNYNTCLVVSMKNKCSTTVVAILYLIMKFKWDMLLAL